MKRALKWLTLSLLALLTLLVIGGFWYLHSKQPQRSGQVMLTKLQSAVTVRYDERGVPHIQAGSEADLFRALGYVHAQDRLFQMEIVRRLARGELAEVLGPKLLDVDRLFRTLGIRAYGDQWAARLDTKTPTSQALLAYLDGINQYQDTHSAPLEFDLLGIPKRPFTPADTASVSGYLAYSFAAAFTTEPMLTQVRDKLGPDYLKVFGIDTAAATPAAAPASAAASAPEKTSRLKLQDNDWQTLNRVASLSHEALQGLGLPQFEGSNAWAVSGSRTASGKPILSGDPHIAFSAPSVWYEAHLSAPGFELYGHFQALSPMALLGHNTRHGWSLTMFQNDDIDLVAEKVNPANANQVWVGGQWVDLQTRKETIRVKGAAPVELTLRRSPHGPIITDVYADSLGKTPVAMWWALYESDNPILDAFYDLAKADTLPAARAAAAKIHAPGLNVVWANATGDIGWWAAARIPVRPEGVNPSFILDGSTNDADKAGFHPFERNPQEENPPRGFIVSANHEPAAGPWMQVPGYYNLSDRAKRLQLKLEDNASKWTVERSKALQLDSGNGYAARVLQPLLPVLKEVVTEPGERALVEQLAQWDGNYDTTKVAPSLFSQLVYELAVGAMGDELGPVQLKNLLTTRALDEALPRLAADASSPWWDNRNTPVAETRADTMKVVWRATLEHLRKTYGTDPTNWTWGHAHTLTHVHPLGRQEPLDKFFNVGPFPVPGGRETPNYLGSAVKPAPFSVTLGPSTRRVIDFADPAHGVGINPIGQSGVLLDTHHSDQAAAYVAGQYMPQHLSEADIASHTRGTLTLQPAR